MGDLRILSPVGVPPNIQRPQPPLSSHDTITTLSTDTHLVSSGSLKGSEVLPALKGTGTAEQMKATTNLSPSPPQDTKLTSSLTIVSASSSTITSTVPSVTTATITSQLVVSPSTASTTTGNLRSSVATPTARHASGHTGSQTTPVCSGIPVPESFIDTVTVTTAATAIHTLVSGSTPTVTIRPGGQALIFTPQKPLQLPDCPREQFNAGQTG